MLKGNGAIPTVLRESDFEPSVIYIYPAKLSFLYEGNWKIFPDVQGLRKYITQILSLENLLNAVNCSPQKQLKSSETIV